MHRSDHIKRIDFTTACFNSDGKPVKGTAEELVVMFNDKIISAEEVNKLIDTGMYEYDQRVIAITKVQADNLAGFTREEAAIMQQFDCSEEILAALKDLKDEIIEEKRHSDNLSIIEKLNILFKKVKAVIEDFKSDDFYENARKYNDLTNCLNEIINNN